MSLLRYLLIFFTFLFNQVVQAHTSSESYLYLDRQVTAPTLEWHIALRDLEIVLGIDKNRDEKITANEVNDSLPNILSYINKSLFVRSSQADCELVVKNVDLVLHQQLNYLALFTSLSCPASLPITQMKYYLFTDIDSGHRGLLNDKYLNGEQNLVFSKDNAAIDFESYSKKSQNYFTTIKQFVYEGIWHILIGLDHLLFLLSLLLPVVLVSGLHYQRREKLKIVCINIFKIVTAFTIAHSITLALAVLELVVLPSKWVESLIAISIIVVALQNIWSLWPRSRYGIAFVFGLIHGFGFANVLLELSVTNYVRALSLVSFNIGVELGQLFIIALCMPLAYWWSQYASYQRYALRGGSVVIIILATIWLFERLYDYDIIAI